MEKKIPLAVDYNYSSVQITRQVYPKSIHPSNMAVAVAVTNSKRVSYMNMRSDGLEAPVQAS